MCNQEIRILFLEGFPADAIDEFAETASNTGY